ncbi:transposase, partial [Alkalimarinus sediminis]
MPKARKTLISLEDTPYYHCVSRCVRRSFLCGKDKLTGANYEHRRQWVEKRLIILSGVFAIDLCAYAVMSNHTHVVLRVNKSKAESWTNRQVIERWHQLYAGNYLSQRFMARQSLGVAEKKQLDIFVQTWRERLFSISWFMRNLNEHIARQANREDNCTGRFWEGRFKSQALLDDKALAGCMAYVDLNPVRACMADTPETSDHTSVKERIRC